MGIDGVMRFDRKKFFLKGSAIRFDALNPIFVYFDLLISVRQSEIVTQSSLKLKQFIIFKIEDLMKVWAKFEGAPELQVNNPKSNQVDVVSLFLFLNKHLFI